MAKLNSKDLPSDLEDLRDYFAGQALASIFKDCVRKDMTPEDISEDVYKIADAMIAERNKR